MFKNYQALATDQFDIKDDEEDAKNNEESKGEAKEDKKDPSSQNDAPQEKRRGRKRKPKSKKTKITDGFDIGGEEELNKALNEFFLVLNQYNGYNLYDFCLRIIEFVLENRHHCQYLIYSPNSVNFLSIFQRVYLTIYQWEDMISLESLLFLSEIIQKDIIKKYQATA